MRTGCDGPARVGAVGGIVPGSGGGVTAERFAGEPAFEHFSAGMTGTIVPAAASPRET